MRFFIFIFLAAASLLPEPVRAADEPLAVVVPRNFSGREPGVQELALIFKRKKLAWDDGTPIQAVNLPSDHPARRHFSQRILKSAPEAQAQYWNAMYFHGVFPPHVVASPEAMLRYVAETSGAIGYVPGCKLDVRVKPVLWIDTAGVVSEGAPSFECPKD
ncbi:MAG: hypothetical protein ACAH09_08640 [Methylophilaceae bacterium]|nr:hypothetical protein [Methylophilaceae bacterium]